MKSRKGIELPLNLIVVLIIILVALVAILFFFTGFGGQLFDAIKGQATTGQDLVKDVPLP